MERIHKPKYLKTILAIIFFTIVFLTVTAFIIIADVWILGKTDTADSRTKEHEVGDFKWAHCGQTHVNNKQRLVKRIIGGEDAEPHSFPFLASVRIIMNNNSDHHCGGTLVTDQYILTAAHCILPYIKLWSQLNMSLPQLFSLMEVHIGVNEHNNLPENLIRDEHVYGIESFDWHEKFQMTSNVIINDIAILKLNRLVNLNRPQVNEKPKKIKYNTYKYCIYEVF